MSNPFDFFDAIFCINLDARKDRWDKCLSNFKDYNIKDKAIRFSACCPKIDGASKKFMARAGCSLSHFMVAKKAEELGLNNYLVLEDDFIFQKKPCDTFGILNKSLDELPKDWDLLYLGCNLDNSYGSFPISPFSNNLFRVSSAHTTHAMALNGPFIKRFSEEVGGEQDIAEWIIKNETIDIFLCRNLLRYINAFVTNPMLILQDESFSDIEGRVFDYSKWMVQSFQKFESQLQAMINQS